MDKPKFKKGDMVRWVTNEGLEGVIADGPFAPGVKWLDPDAGYFDDITHVVLFKEPNEARLLSERTLRPVEQWVDCPGEHRCVQRSDTKGNIWERRVS